MKFIEEKEAFLINLKDTLNSPQLTVMDHALHQKRLREEFRWPSKKIAEFYGRTPSWVSELRALSRLHPVAQRAVRNGRITIMVAYSLKDMNRSAQRDFIRELEKNGEGSAKEARRLKRVQAGRNPGVRSASRSKNEIGEFLKSLLEKEQPKGLSKFVRNFLKFIDGDLKDEEMEQILREMFTTE